MTKNLFFFLMCILCSTSFLKAQVQHTNLILNGKGQEVFGNFAQVQNSGKHHFYKVANQESILDAKTLQWNRDTLITYDTISAKARNSRTFNTNGKLLTEKGEKWVAGAWENEYRQTNTLNANGNSTSEFYEAWVAKAWANDGRGTYTYNTNGKVATIVFETWENNAWVFGDKITNTYDANGNLLVYLIETWQTNAYVNNFRTTNTYNTLGKLLTTLPEEWQNNAWVKMIRTSNTYDGSGNKLSSLNEMWQNNVWVNSSKTTYTYDGTGNMLTAIGTYWYNGAWVNVSRETFSYDANFNRTSSLRESYSGVAWVNDFKITYTYNANGNSLSGKVEKWISGSWHQGISTIDVMSGKKVIESPYNIYRFTTSFKSFTNTNIKDVSDNVSFAIFPNPSNNNITIQFPSNDAKNMVINVYNLQGQLLIEQSNNLLSTDLDISNLAKGVYFVKIKNNGNTEISKFVKE